MLNEERIKLMTKLAMYEAHEGKEDLAINAYQKKDYISINAWITAVWVTIGYVVVVALAGLIGFDYLMTHLRMSQLMVMAGAVCGVYVALLIVSVVIARNFFTKRHNQARKRVKKFSFYLTRLNKMYEKERK